MSTAFAHSPLNSLSHPLPFDHFNSEEVIPNVEELLKEVNQAMRDLETSSPCSPQALITQLDQLGGRLEAFMTYYSQLESLLGTDELREALREVQPKVSAFYATIPFSEPLFQKLLEAREHKEYGQLKSEEQRYLTRTIESFKRNGAQASAEAKVRLEAIERELAEITLRFAQHVVEETDRFEWVTQDETLLEGLPPSALASAAASASMRGLTGWRFSLQGPSFISVMTYCKTRWVREHFYTAYTTRASSGERDNRSLIKRILHLRTEKAHLLGYQDVSDLYLASRMVKTGKAARQFVDDLISRTEYSAQVETDELNHFAQETLGWDEQLQAWDVSYVAEKLRQHTCQYDEEQLKPYFEVKSVMRGMFQIVERLYEVSVRALDNIPVWHQDVMTFELVQSDQQIGVFYADLFPREGKQGGAWMCPLLYRTSHQPHVGLICANFSPPVEGRSLITHREVETLFHEFGHLLHHLLTEVELKSQAGTNVAWDFVELPSQIMENWCWEKEALDLFARHWQTEAPLPEDLFDRLLKTRTFRAGTAQMRQLSFAEIDLILHQDYPTSEVEDVVRFARDQMTKRSPTPLREDYAMINGFTHLFASSVGYAAAYYSYKWAEVLDADAFTRFKHEGLFSTEVGTAFRTHILSRGDSEDPATLFEEFMGRPPSSDALFDRLGITQVAD